MAYKERGLLIVLSGPSGVGKGTVCRALRGRGTNLQYSVSMTTRKPREGERDGVDYFFKSRSEFEQKISENKLLEWAEYVGNYYGTPLEYVEEQLENGKDVILEIEVQGAMQVKQNFSEGIFIFLVPPSISELKNRITGRGTEDTRLINTRLDTAKEELDMMANYNYVVENDKVDAACGRIEAIVTAEHCRQERMSEKYKRLTEVDKR